jgi:hypothetical protein
MPRSALAANPRKGTKYTDTQPGNASIRHSGHTDAMYMLSIVLDLRIPGGNACFGASTVWFFGGLLSSSTCGAVHWTAVSSPTAPARECPS